MSESEVKTLTGVCVAVTERNGWTEFEIDHGGEYKTKLSTKLQPLVELGRAAGSNLATWTFKQSQGKENPNRPGTYFQNRYLERVEVGGTQTQTDATDSPAAQKGPALGSDKDRLIVRQVCIKAAAGIDWTQTTGPVDVALSVMQAADRFERWIFRDMDEVPF